MIFEGCRLEWLESNRLEFQPVFILADRNFPNGTVRWSLPLSVFFIVSWFGAGLVGSAVSGCAIPVCIFMNLLYSGVGVLYTVFRGKRCLLVHGAACVRFINVTGGPPLSWCFSVFEESGLVFFSFFQFRGWLILFILLNGDVFFIVT